MLTLGFYLKHRRKSARLSLEEVAGRFATEPRYAQHVRAGWLALIEADAAEPSFMTIVVLGAIYPIDMDVLIALAARDQRRPLPPICPSCACSAGSPCIDQVNLAVCARGPNALCSICRAEIETLIEAVAA